MQKYGEWLRLSELSETEDDRYQCSVCKNIVHHSSRINLYEYNSYCGKCGSLNNSWLQDAQKESLVNDKQ